MSEFRIVHVSDGATVANLISKKFTGNKYNLSVELFDLRRRPLSSLFSSFPELADSSADISILLVTPAMISYLKDLTEDERSSLILLMKSNQIHVNLSFCVPILQVKDQISVLFDDPHLLWRHIEVTESKESFHQCMIELISIMEEGRCEMPIPTLKKCHFLPEKPVLAGDTVYVLVEKHLVDYSEIQSLCLKFEDGRQVIANQIADGLFQFEVPENTGSSKMIEIFTSKGQSLGFEFLRYRSKLQVIAGALSDILKSEKFICQSEQLDELLHEVVAPLVTNMFNCEDKPYTSCVMRS